MKTTSLKITKLTAFVAVIALFALGSCDGFAPTIKVPFESEAEFNLTPSTAKSTVDTDLELLHTWGFDQDLNALIEEYGGNAEKIKESNIKTVTLTLLGENNVDLSQIFASLKLMVDKNPAELEELVAQSTTITANSVSFELVKGDILNYTSGANGFTFLLYGDVNWNNLLQTINLKITVTSELVVELL